MFGSYIMFHYVRGVPFEFNAGAFDNLNMWEQIDNGAQYTPAKKFLLAVPIVLFLLSTHYTHYDLAYFIINFLAVLGVIIPKLPFVRRPRWSLQTLHPRPLFFSCSRETMTANTGACAEPSHAGRALLGLSGGLTASGLSRILSEPALGRGFSVLPPFPPCFLPCPMGFCGPCPVLLVARDEWPLGTRRETAENGLGVLLQCRGKKGGKITKIER